MGSNLRQLFSPSAVKLNATARDKQQAIVAAGELLVVSDFVDRPYITEMLKREEIITTYIGNGVAIPHGTEASRDMVYKTGLSFVQLPQGVDFDGNTAYVIIGIAAKDNSHLQILANLAEILCETKTVEKLVEANSFEDVIDLLTTPPNERPTQQEE